MSAHNTEKDERYRHQPQTVSETRCSTFNRCTWDNSRYIKWNDLIDNPNQNRNKTNKPNHIQLAKIGSLWKCILFHYILPIIFKVARYNIDFSELIIHVALDICVVLIIIKKNSQEDSDNTCSTEVLSCTFLWIITNKHDQPVWIQYNTITVPSIFKCN